MLAVDGSGTYCCSEWLLSFTDRIGHDGHSDTDSCTLVDGAIRRSVLEAFQSKNDIREGGKSISDISVSVDRIKASPCSNEKSF